MKYRVYDVIEKQYVTDDSNIVLKPNGTLAVNEYGDEIRMPHYIALFHPTEDNAFYIDSVGGKHDSGCGWAPDGRFCGECSNISCDTCSVWVRKKV